MAVMDVSDWEVVADEPLGRERKIWLHEPWADKTSRRSRWLVKPVVVPAHGRRQGEDWAEKIAADLAGLIGVSCAQVELAVRNGVEGSLSRNVAPDGWSLVLGELLLQSVSPAYDGGSTAPRGRPGHTPAAIQRALADCPSTDPGLSAFDMFCGYLVFDAWIANRDRHDQNWAVLRRATPPEARVLAPSYDHASGLGFNLDDGKRADLLVRGLDGWARRGTAHRMEHDASLSAGSLPTLVDVAHDALALAGAGAASLWSGRIAALSRDDVEGIVRRTPRMSGVAATFVMALLDTNRRRLLA